MASSVSLVVGIKCRALLWVETGLVVELRRCRGSVASRQRGSNDGSTRRIVFRAGIVVVRRPADLEQVANLFHASILVLAPFSCELRLLLVQLLRSPTIRPPRSGCLQSGLCVLDHVVAFKLCERRDDVKEKLPGGRSGVDALV